MKETPNPYHPIGDPDSIKQRIDPDSLAIQPINKLAMTVWVLVYSFPLLTILSVYGCWLLAWATLGHQPKPMINDPKYIGGPLDGAYFVSMIMLMFAPFVAPFGLITPFSCPAFQPPHATKSLVLLAIYVAIIVLGVMLLRSDPGGVVEWYMD